MKASADVKMVKTLFKKTAVSVLIVPLATSSAQLRSALSSVMAASSEDAVSCCMPTADGPAIGCRLKHSQHLVSQAGLLLAGLGDVHTETSELLYVLSASLIFSKFTGQQGV